jgi:hypothetical protein
MGDVNWFARRSGNDRLYCTYFHWTYIEPAK